MSVIATKRHAEQEAQMQSLNELPAFLHPQTEQELLARMDHAAEQADRGLVYDAKEALESLRKRYQL